MNLVLARAKVSSITHIFLLSHKKPSIQQCHYYATKLGTQKRNKKPSEPNRLSERVKKQGFLGYGHLKSSYYDAVQLKSDVKVVETSKSSEIETESHKKNARLEQDSAGTEKDGNLLSFLWEDLVKNPGKWYYYPDHTTNGVFARKHPDFLQRGTGKILWINDAPSWVLPEIQRLWSVVVKGNPGEAKEEADSQNYLVEQDTGEGKNEEEAKGGDSQTSLLKHPTKLWGNRLGKTNDGAPDFTRKESEQATLSDSSKSLVEVPSNRSGKTGPRVNVIHKESGISLWISNPLPWVLLDLEQLGYFVKDDRGSKAKTARNKKDAVGDLLRDLVRNPFGWYDYRGHKLNELVHRKHPDFKRKDSDEVLWVNNIPPWVLPGIENLKFDVKDVTSGGKKDAKGDDLWKSLLEDPSKWWDNRLGKKNPKAPDFRHKESKEALWVNSAPSWVIPKLEDLQSVGKDVSGGGGKKEAKGDDLWKSMLEDPSKWWDNRLGKKNPKAPDFRHKESKEALWVESAPSWVIPELEDLRFVKGVQWDGKKGAKGKDSRKSLVASKWWDNRLGKKNPKAPDFKHKESKEALWVNSAPSWVIPELEDLRSVKGVQWDDKKEAKGKDSWKSLVASKWWDKRGG